MLENVTDFSSLFTMVSLYELSFNFSIVSWT